MNRVSQFFTVDKVYEVGECKRIRLSFNELGREEFREALDESAQSYTYFPPIHEIDSFANQLGNTPASAHKVRFDNIGIGYHGTNYSLDNILVSMAKAIRRRIVKCLKRAGLDQEGYAVVLRQINDLCITFPKNDDTEIGQLSFFLTFIIVRNEDELGKVIERYLESKEMSGKQRRKLDNEMEEKITNMGKVNAMQMVIG
jgi:hypothetical protein